MSFDFTTSKSNETLEISAKWAALPALFGGDVPPDTIPMWIAQMDFLPGPFLTRAAERLAREGEWGYFRGLDGFLEDVAWWYETRHGWRPDPAHILATHGLGNAIGMALQALTDPGDVIITFSPVYHEFHFKIRRNGREELESPLLIDADGKFRMDLDALEAQLTGREKMVIFSAPHNPAGRVWSVDEMKALAAFCLKHDLILISDEIHMDIVFDGYKHVPFAQAAPEIVPNLVTISAASKTFDIAGLRCGYAIIPDDNLRGRFERLHRALDIQPNRAGLELTRAAYSEDGAAWVDDLVRTIEGNWGVFRDAIETIPGVSAMPMEGTYLAWVDFADTGMSEDEIKRRLHRDARLGPTPGADLGLNGAHHARFNLGTPRARVEEAANRLVAAFSDLQ